MSGLRLTSKSVSKISVSNPKPNSINSNWFYLLYMLFKIHLRIVGMEEDEIFTRGGKHVLIVTNLCKNMVICSFVTNDSNKAKQNIQTTAKYREKICVYFSSSHSVFMHL